jgi:hypothetical protein
MNFLVSLSPALILGAVLLVMLTATWALVGREWRWVILALALQYVGVFLLVAVSWPLEMAVVKVVAGWMSGAALGLGMANTSDSMQEAETAWPSGRVFRLLAAGLVVVVVLSLARAMPGWLPRVNIYQVWGSFILMGMGLLHLGLTNHPFRIAVGLLTMVSGFEILYAAVENSTLVAGLLAVITLGIALGGVYLLIVPSMEEDA